MFAGRTHWVSLYIYVHGIAWKPHSIAKDNTRFGLNNVWHVWYFMIFLYYTMVYFNPQGPHE